VREGVNGKHECTFAPRFLAHTVPKLDGVMFLTAHLASEEISQLPASASAATAGSATTAAKSAASRPTAPDGAAAETATAAETAARSAASSAA